MLCICTYVITFIINDNVYVYVYNTCVCTVNYINGHYNQVYQTLPVSCSWREIESGHRIRHVHVSLTGDLWCQSLNVVLQEGGITCLSPCLTWGFVHRTVWGFVFHEGLEALDLILSLENFEIISGWSILRRFPFAETSKSMDKYTIRLAIFKNYYYAEKID